MLKKLSLFLISFFVFLFLASTSFASTLYLSPASANIPQGSIVSVQVRLNTQGESINGISAYLSYPQDKLEVASLSFGGSFPIAAEGTYGGGGIRISRGNISGVVGDLNVATIGFRGKSQGGATVSFIAGSGAPRTSDSSDSLNLGGSRGGTFTVGAAKASTPAPTGTFAKPIPTLPKDTTQPIIANVVVSSVSKDSSTITWQTNEKADSLIEYGLEKNRYFLEEGSKDLTTEHSIKLEGPVLAPGALLHFRVKSKDEAGNEGVSNDTTLRLKGYIIRVRVIDTNNKPIKDTEVLLYTDALRSMTNLNGEALFTDVTAGKHLVVVKLKNTFDKTQEINVAESNDLQKFTLNVDLSYKNNFVTTVYIIVFILILGLAVSMVVIFKKRRDIKNT